jgi:hypothetical protein
MFRGALIMESIRVGTLLHDLNLVVRDLYRYRPGETAFYQPDIWTVLEFEISDDDAPALAEAFSGVLEPRGWYVDFRSQDEQFVVFAGRVFRYAKSDQAARAQAQAHGRTAGVPEAQLDWSD